MLRIVCFLGFVFCYSFSYGQLDAPRKSIEVGGNQDNDLPTSILVSPEDAKSSISSGTISIKSKLKLSELLSGNLKEKARFTNGDQFAKKEYKKVTKKLNDAFAKADKPIKPEYLKNQYLGDFKSGSKFVKFLYRDHEFVDGDRVRVYINDHIVHHNILLTGEFQGFYIDLEKGFNRIDIEALNQGESGPNTAQFVMYDDNKQVISSNVWNLATGVKATVIIIKD